MKKLLASILLYINYFSAALLLLSYLSVYVSPADFWFIAFLGLSYPFLLIINILFLIFWIYFRKKVLLISLLSILIGWNTISNHIQIPISKKSRDKSFHKNIHQLNTIKVLSYNVRLFNRYNWANNKTARDEIFSFVRDEDPEILCIQEFFSRKNSDITEESIKTNLKQFPYSHIHYSIKASNQSNFGIATFSKYPIIQRGIMQFENTPNLCIFSDIDYYGDTIRIYNNHLQSIKLNRKNYDFFSKLNLRNEENIEEVKDISSRLKQAYIKRAQQVDLISGHIKNAAYPVIICGDFNDTPVSYTFKKMKGKLNDAFVESGSWVGNSYLGKLPSFRIDYILYSKDFNSYNYRTHRVKYSDHYPISCYIEKIN